MKVVILFISAFVFYGGLWWAGYKIEQFNLSGGFMGLGVAAFAFLAYVKVLDIR